MNNKKSYKTINKISCPFHASKQNATKRPARASAKDSYYMCGKHAVMAALENPNRKIEEIYCTENFLAEHNTLMLKYKFQIVNAKFFEKLQLEESSHQGIVVRIKTIFDYNFSPLDFVNPECRLAVLDQITDVNNIGSIIRSAAAFDIDAIIMPINNSPNENAGLAKAASGMLEKVKIIKVVNLKQCLDELKKYGFWVIGFDASSTKILEPKLLTDRIVIILGSEDKGIRKLTQDTCDHVVRINMSSKAESLNVSNAAAIAFHMIYSSKV